VSVDTCDECVCESEDVEREYWRMGMDMGGGEQGREMYEV